MAKTIPKRGLLASAGLDGSSTALEDEQSVDALPEETPAEESRSEPAESTDTVDLDAERERRAPTRRRKAKRTREDQQLEQEQARTSRTKKVSSVLAVVVNAVIGFEAAWKKQYPAGRPPTQRWLIEQMVRAFLHGDPVACIAKAWAATMKERTPVPTSDAKRGDLSFRAAEDVIALLDGSTKAWNADRTRPRVSNAWIIDRAFVEFVGVERLAKLDDRGAKDGIAPEATLLAKRAAEIYAESFAAATAKGKGAAKN